MNDTGLTIGASAYGQTRTLREAVNDLEGVSYVAHESATDCRNYMENRKLTEPPNAVNVLETLVVPPCVDMFNADNTDIVGSIWTSCVNHWLGFDMHIFEDHSCQEVFSFYNTTGTYPKYTLVPMQNTLFCTDAQPLINTVGFVALSCPKSMKGGPGLVDHLLNWVSPFLPSPPSVT
jgi:hypothetical protein